MPITNYPGGFAAGLTVRGMPILNAHAGNVFWVNSATGSNGNNGTFGRPFSTLDYAIGRCTANNGDMIMVMPNHAETITGAGGITADVAGITIVGMGTYNQRPRFLMDGGTTVSFLVSAADVTVKNCVFASGNADVVTCFDLTAVGFTLEDCEFVDNVADENFLSAVKATGSTTLEASGLYVARCRFLSADAATLGFVIVTADVEGLVMVDNVVVSEGTGLATMLTCATGKDVKRCFIARNFLSSKATSGNLFISNDTASPNNSGIVAHNRCGHADVTAGHVLGVVGGCRMFDNLSVSTDALSGFVIPAIDVDS
jgi:hypothetical protein